MPLAPADGRVVGIGVAKLTARLTVPAVLFEPDHAPEVSGASQHADARVISEPGRVAPDFPTTADVTSDPTGPTRPGSEIDSQIDGRTDAQTYAQTDAKADPALTIDLETSPATDAQSIPAMQARLANIDLAAGIEELRQHGVWADRWTSPDLLAQLRACRTKPADTIICNVLDESPDLLLHHTLAANYAVEMVAGVLAIAHLTGAKELLMVLAAFGDASAWDAVRQASADTNIKVVPLRDHYPQAHPTLLIHEMTGRHSRPVRLPTNSGTFVLDAAAAIAVGRSFLFNQPMTSVPVGLRQRLHDQTHWLDVPIGMPWSTVLAHLSIAESTVDLRAGNPLRETRLTDDCVAGGAEHCVMASPHERFLNANACIRCAWCVEGCPVEIQPAGLLEAAQQDDPYLGDTYGLDACIECGICSYVCPSHLPILEGIRALRLSNFRTPAVKA